MGARAMAHTQSVRRGRAAVQHSGLIAAHLMLRSRMPSTPCRGTCAAAAPALMLHAAAPESLHSRFEEHTPTTQHTASIALSCTA
jgi:hypothetical protein